MDGMGGVREREESKKIPRVFVFYFFFFLILLLICLLFVLTGERSATQNDHHNSKVNME